MIRINLLPAKQTKKRSGAQQQLLAGVAVIFLLILALYYVVSEEQKSIAGLKKEHTAVQKKIDELKEIVGDIDKAKAEKEALEKKSKVITDLKSNRMGPVRMLDELSIIIPKKVWLVSLSETGVDQLKLEGYVVDHNELSTFMRNLEKSPFFNDVILTIDCLEGAGNCGSSAKSGAPMQVYFFSISVKYRLA